MPTAKDVLASSLPTTGALLLRGVRPAEIVMEFLGKGAAPSGGRSGVRDFGDIGRGIVATTGHAATHVSVMAGFAFSARVQHQDRVALALVSDEAVATGDFHEGMNFAAVRKAPLVVVVVRFPSAGRIGGPLAASEVSQLYERARGYGVTSLPVDGSDLLQVVQVVETAMDRAKSGEGPTLIEAPLRSSTRYFGNDDAGPGSVRRGGASRPDALRERDRRGRQSHLAVREVSAAARLAFGGGAHRDFRPRRRGGLGRAEGGRRRPVRERARHRGSAVPSGVLRRE